MIPFTENMLDMERNDGTRIIRKGWFRNRVVELPRGKAVVFEHETVIHRIALEVPSMRTRAGAWVHACLCSGPASASVGTTTSAGKWPVEFLENAWPTGRALLMAILVPAGDRFWLASTFDIGCAMLVCGEKVWDGPPKHERRDAFTALADWSRQNATPATGAEKADLDDLVRAAIEKEHEDEDEGGGGGGIQ